jgi:Fe-S cluster assembly protein SufB
MAAVQETVDRVRSIEVDAYKYGFVSPIQSDMAPKGLNEDTVRFISERKAEPEWLLEWRLEAFRRWQTMEEPKWARVNHPPINYQEIYYFAAPKSGPAPKSLDEVDPELLRTYAKLGIPLVEQEILAGVEKPRVAVDAVFDSVSIATTFKAELAKAGVIFCSFSEAVRNHPDLVRRYLGTVVPSTDNFYATLNSAVFSDGSFVYVPSGVRCPMELSTYFRINERNTGQFERTLIIADRGAYVSYLEGCTAPKRDENQLHAAVVELITLDDAEIKYSTVQNWYPGDSQGRPIENLLDAGGNRLGDHLEVSVLHFARRGLARGILFDRDFKRSSAGRQRHEDDSSGPQHDEPHHFQGGCRWQIAKYLSGSGVCAPAGDRSAQFHQLRLALDRARVRRAHGPLY